MPQFDAQDAPEDLGRALTSADAAADSDVAETAEVIVVGAGPAGATVATHLARAGIDVLLLEKSVFPRDKVCGDGLTPRGVKQVLALGIDVSGPDWVKNKGLRVVGGGRSIELPWPVLQDFPDFGLVRTRRDFDELLATLAVKAGARLRVATTVTGPIRDETTGRIIGVTATVRPEGADADDAIDGGASGADAGEPRRGARRRLQYRAPLVIAADGVSARVALGMGIAKRDDRPLGVAVRRYYRSEARTHDDHLESHLELWDRSDAAKPKLLPGYGWIFGLGDGTVNVGLGMLNSSSAFGKTDYRALLRTWLDGTPEEWGLREEHALGGIGGAALPMGFNRVPHYADGLLLVGDAAGAVNPFNGEGIAYAMESASLAAESVIQAVGRRDAAGREAALAGYATAMREHLGSYYRLGGWFSTLIGHPRIMRTATQLGLPRQHLMHLVLKLLAGLHDTRDGDWADRVVRGLTKLAPSV